MSINCVNCISECCRKKVRTEIKSCGTIFISKLSRVKQNSFQKFKSEKEKRIRVICNHKERNRVKLVLVLNFTRFNIFKKNNLKK